MHRNTLNKDQVKERKLFPLLRVINLFFYIILVNKAFWCFPSLAYIRTYIYSTERPNSTQLYLYYIIVNKKKYDILVHILTHRIYLLRIRFCWVYVNFIILSYFEDRLNISHPSIRTIYEMSYMNEDLTNSPYFAAFPSCVCSLYTACMFQWSQWSIKRIISHFLLESSGWCRFINATLLPACLPAGAPTPSSHTPPWRRIFSLNK